MMDMVNNTTYGIMNIKYILVCCCLIFTQWMMAQRAITIEAASDDRAEVVHGIEKKVDYVNNPVWLSNDNYLALFTSSYGKGLYTDKQTYTAIQVDKDSKVTALINGVSGKGERPAFSEKLNINIPEDGFVLVASDNSYAEKGFKKFLAENFRIGDVVKLRIDGEISSVKDVLVASAKVTLPSIVLDQDFMVTTIGNKHSLKGQIVNYDSRKAYKIEVRSDGKKLTLRPGSKGKFATNLELLSGTNFFDVVLYSGNEETSRQSIVVYSKAPDNTARELVMWLEQFPNAKVLTNDQAVADMVAKVKSAGFTAIGIDVKGPEGYVSYRKNNLSGTPYFTSTKNPNKKVADTGFDLLESVISESHKLGIRVYASFNFFTEGNITTQDYAILDRYKDWEEIVQRPEDKGKLLKITESNRGKDAAAGKFIALAFVNPSNKEVQDFQLLRVREVLDNYNIDGIVLDRCRYDNLYADFSHTSRNAFDDYLQAEGKTLENFPADAFLINKSGELVKGKYYKEWITFRSQTISRFTDRIRDLVDSYKKSKNPDLKMAGYVGSWYEVYYQNGVNWASDEFAYNSRLNFPESELYGEKYNQTSLLHNLDFLMIGTYYKTAKEVNRYITLGNILTQGKVPILGSMSLPDLKKEEQGEVFKASLQNSSGLMIFDYCYVDWSTFMEQMKIAFSKKKNKY